MPQPSPAHATLEAKLAGLRRLEALSETAEFLAAVDLLERTARCVVTGMGKSGIVARKIAATFQSTGQRSVFLDPAAAAHGDMGIIEQSDTILMISNSGETDELRGVANYTVGKCNPIILVTGRARSRLARMAEHVLRLPDCDEGDPIGRVPMASITCQIAVGDMLAAELMVRRGFTESDFLAVHHGGYLGRQNSAAA